MNKLIFLSLAVGSFIYAGVQSNPDTLCDKLDSSSTQYTWSQGISEDDSKLEAGRRRGKRNKGDRRRGGGGLR